jgi:hypothetical protein
MEISPQRGYCSVRFDRNGIAVEIIMDASRDVRERNSPP